MRFRTQVGFVFFAVVVAATTEAQNAPRQRTQLNPAGGVSSTASPQQSDASPSEPIAASSLLDQPAKPAQVGLDSGELSVKADNSALSDILKNISAKTGMSVDGLSRDQRIFGTYGPAAPREVLSALLDGLGYNVMMVGALGNGAPRELTLTLRTAGNSTSGNNQAPTRARQDNSNSISNSDDDEEVSPEQQDTPIPPRPEASNSPEQNQPPDQQQPPANQGQPGQVRTPQQMLQELQQMRQLQMQQQQASPQ